MNRGPDYGTVPNRRQAFNWLKSILLMQRHRHWWHWRLSWIAMMPTLLTLAALKIVVNFHDANFVGTGGTEGCQELPWCQLCCHWRQRRMSTLLLSIERSDRPKLHDMFKARDAQTWQRKFPVGFPVRVCALNLSFINIFHDVAARMESRFVIKARHVLLVC